jgi:BCD family chlorophyll transporter-like MFS transporter
LVALCVGLLSLSGFSSNPALLKVALFLFGLASGVTTTGSISLVLDLTAAETAGTYIGAWGLGQAMARGIAVASGGSVLDLGQSLFTSSKVAYGLVFGIEALGMVLAVWLLSRIDVTEFRTNAKLAITSVLETELE